MAMMRPASRMQSFRLSPDSFLRFPVSPFIIPLGIVYLPMMRVLAAHPQTRRQRDGGGEKGAYDWAGGAHPRVGRRRAPTAPERIGA